MSQKVSCGLGLHRQFTLNINFLIIELPQILKFIPKMALWKIL